MAGTGKAIKQLLIQQWNKNAGEFVHFDQEYDEAVAQGRFRAAAVIGSYLKSLSKKNIQLDAQISELSFQIS